MFSQAETFPNRLKKDLVSVDGNDFPLFVISRRGLILKGTRIESVAATF